MADKNIKEFVTDLNGRFSQANTILSGLNGVEGKTYTYMKKSINDLLRISLDEDLSFEKEMEISKEASLDEIEEYTM